MELTQKYPYVILLDCIYKTNKFQMPLYIIGVTSLNSTFSSCFVFLMEEKEANYVWILKRVKSLFDDGVTLLTLVIGRELAMMFVIEKVFHMSTNLFCVLYINKYIFINCKQFFFVDEWTNFI